MNINLPNGAVTRILPQTQRAGGIILQNNTEVDIYLGGEDVTADDEATGGYKLLAGGQLSLSDGGGADLSTRVLHAVHGDAGDVKVTMFLM